MPDVAAAGVCAEVCAGVCAEVCAGVGRAKAAEMPDVAAAGVCAGVELLVGKKLVILGISEASAETLGNKDDVLLGAGGGGAGCFLVDRIVARTALSGGRSTTARGIGGATGGSGGPGAG